MARMNGVKDTARGRPTRPERCVPEADGSWLPKSGRFVGTTHRLDSLVGEGGVSRVYAAFDLTLSRRVAIKMLRPELSEREDLRTALVAEARALAAFHHPRIVGIHGCDTHRGEPFVVMELVDGADLSVRIKESGGYLPLVFAREVIAGMAEGVAAMHDAGTPHGDLKPSNVLVDARGCVKLIDVGCLASGLGIEGTPAYMAPERRNGGGPSAADDLYAFAVTAHEILTGSRAHDKPIASRSGPTFEPMVAAHRGVSPDVDVLLALALSVEPGARPRGITPFASALLRALVR
ncbi:MAG: serine/threonine protein kinase [Deltaproteobacteria bacterium]|nr:serine/threonine protein kinase [Deltaproteobacteria bacterium]